jgi:hypothetical protein
MKLRTLMFAIFFGLSSLTIISGCSKDEDDNQQKTQQNEHGHSHSHD